MHQFNGNNRLVRTFMFCLVFLGFVFTSTQSQANEPDLVHLYYKLNNNKSVEDMGALAKTMFKSKEDHRQIDQDVKSWAKRTKKWKWRFDVKRSGIVQFRVNGKVQFSTKLTKVNQKVFEVNGEKVVFSNHLSYLSYKNAFSKILAKKQANLDFLFIDKAYAGVPILFGLAAVGMVSFAASEATGTSVPTAENNKDPQVCMLMPHLPTHLGAGAAYWDKINYADYRGGGMTCKNFIPTIGYKRLAMVIENFKPNGKFRRGQAHKKCQHLPNATQAQQFAKAQCECVQRKTHISCDYGWDMSQQGAQRICDTALTIYKSCNTRRGTVPVSNKVATVPISNKVDPVTPCYKDKNGNFPPECNATANHCNVAGNPPPGCPGHNPDPVTPYYGGKGAGNAESDTAPVESPATTYTPTEVETSVQPQPETRQPMTDNNHSGGDR